MAPAKKIDSQVTPRRVRGSYGDDLAAGAHATGGAYATGGGPYDNANQLARFVAAQPAWYSRG